MSTVKYPDVTVKLVGSDGNAFAIMGNVSRAIKAKHGLEASKQFSNEAMMSASYDALLQLVMETVNVE